MTLYHKVRAVEKVLGQLHVEIQKFQEQSKLSCLAQCGKCCLKPDIEASALEFLPLAYHLQKEGYLDEYYEKVLTHQNDSVCVLFNPFLGKEDKGNCSRYAYRGLICRAFGFSANYDKHGIPRLVTCQTIKTAQPNEASQANENIKNGMDVPIIRNYYQRLFSIDFVLAGKVLPINQAIIEAIETVLGYYSYRTRPGKRSACASECWSRVSDPGSSRYRLSAPSLAPPTRIGNPNTARAPASTACGEKATHLVVSG